ncbi:MAG TPA: CpsD/CapB family tyrosine-protein kinase [Terriglobia bacterium]|jgi:capsular exopolysaccharide synthesis family protein|nr:CpsD/CapB family tyrosine-protein kinase [Terriglobia bacterium]
MSRIHEALKKAELERGESLSALGQEPLAPAAEVAPATALPVEEPQLAVHEERVFEPVTLDLLRQRCPIGDWHPDSKAVLFADATAKTHPSGAEEFRTLRSRLYHLREKAPLQTVLITSALPSEGKTFVSLNLARSIAQQAHRSVLVIDADLRISRIHEGVGAAQSPGLSDYLKGEVDALDVIQRGPQDNLFVVAGGSSNSNPVELLSTGRLRTLIHRFSTAFDWILLDSPPAVYLSDSSLLAKVSDGVVLVVQSGLTPYDSAQKACKEFTPEQLVGVVLNRVPPGRGYYYDYYYGHGYGRGQKRPEQNKGKATVVPSQP